MKNIIIIGISVFIVVAAMNLKTIHNVSSNKGNAVKVAINVLNAFG